MPKKKKRRKLLKKKPSSVKKQRFTQVQKLGRSSLSAREFRLLRRMTHASKALRNVALHVVREVFFETSVVTTGTQIDKAMKDDINYSCLQSNCVQAIRNTVLDEFNSFFKALKDWKENPGKYKGKPKMPFYSKPTAKRVIEIHQPTKVGKDGRWKLPMSTDFRKKFGDVSIKMPQNLHNKKVTYIEIVPKKQGRFFEVHYTYEVDVPQMKKTKNTTTNVLGIDLGVKRLMSCATNHGDYWDSFLIDGKKLTSINQYFNKKLAEQQQKNLKNGISKKITTKKQACLWEKRDRQINGYISQAVGLLFKKVKELEIDTIVIGRTKEWKQKTKMGRKNNRKFVHIPFLKLLEAVKNKCLKEGIKFIEQEESFTSKASFLDRDFIPVFEKGDKTKYKFSGKRTKRGLYESPKGKIHADINAALNIIRKSNVVDMNRLEKVRTPKVYYLQQKTTSKVAV